MKCSGCEKPRTIINQKYKLCNICNKKRLATSPQVISGSVSAQKGIRVPLRGKSSPKAKKSSISKLVKKLDTIFSVFIRLRDTQDGVAKCITCSVALPPKEMQCGHFVTRAAAATRWSEQNTAAQCGKCNCFRGGESYLFGLEIDKKYGKGTADMLQIKRHNTFKKERIWMEMLIQEYKQKVEALLIEKGIPSWEKSY